MPIVISLSGAIFSHVVKNLHIDGSLPVCFNKLNRRAREERFKQAQDLEAEGKVTEARRVMAQSARITFDVVAGLIKVRAFFFLANLILRPDCIM